MKETILNGHALTMLEGDCCELLKTLPNSSINCCVTSPPYWGLRDYGHAGQLGLERTPQEYVDRMTEIFREVRRVLRGDGTLWLNLGDSYAGSGRGPSESLNKQNPHSHYAACRQRIGSVHGDRGHTSGVTPPPGLKPKDLIGIPWRVALALQADGWYLRSDIIWHKPNPMPESVTDRPTKSHEYIFLLAKSEKYFYDQDAIKEAASYNTHERVARVKEGHKSTPSAMKNGIRGRKLAPTGSGIKNNGSFDAAMAVMPDSRNKRSVWTIKTAPYAEAHFATFPPDLVKPCILAGCPVGGVVLDPFAGSGTTGMVALELGRKAVLIELNPEYVKLINQRTNVTPGFELTETARRPELIGVAA